MTIAVTDLVHQYPGGVVALDGVSLRIDSGEQVVIVGENGAGKTTLVKHFNGLLKPTAGSVIVAGTETAEATVASLSRHVGYVFQNPDDQLFSRTVRQEVAVGPRNLSFAPDRVEHLVEEAMRLTGITELADENPYDVHPTRRKLVALAAVLAMDTPTLILDEPTIGQDGAGVGRLARLVAELAAGGRGIVAITHDVDFAAENFERMIVMARGRVLADGPTAEVVQDFELLAEAAVEPPQLTRLGRALGWEGVHDQETFLSALAHHRQPSGEST